MPHDLNGVELKEGDRVLIPCTVKKVHEGEDFCNVNLETEEFMPGLKPKQKSEFTLNTKQCFKTEG